MYMIGLMNGLKWQKTQEYSDYIKDSKNRNRKIKRSK